MGTFIGVIVVIALFCAYSYFAYRISFRPLNKALEELEKQRRELDSARTAEMEKEQQRDLEEKSDDMPQARD